jgi:hypothetical protein
MRNASLTLFVNGLAVLQSVGMHEVMDWESVHSRSRTVRPAEHHLIAP